MEKPVRQTYPFDAIAGLVPPGRKAYLVGGSVRDLLIGRAVTDIDIAVDEGPGELASSVAAAMGGTAFVMDEKRRVFRVMVKGEPALQVDVSPLKGTVEEDLAARDFTINAMAVMLAGGKASEGEVIDPYGGMRDLKARLIRSLGRAAFIDDPLRLVRAFRLRAQLGFAVEGATLERIRGLAPSAGSVSAERVRDELSAILDADGSAGVFREMSAAGLLRALIPETGPMEGLVQGEPHAHDLMEHSLRAMGYAECVMESPGRYFGPRAAEAEAFFGSDVPGGPSMRGLIKLAALLHDVGKPAKMKREGGRVRFTGHDSEGAGINAVIADRLKLSGRAKEVLCLVAETHMRPLHMSFDVPSRRALYRYARDMKDALVAGLVVAVADAMATRESPGSPVTDMEGTAQKIAEYYYGEYAKAREKPLLTGRDLIEVFGLSPSPAFGRILEEVEMKKAEGELKDREQALEFVGRNLERLT